MMDFKPRFLFLILGVLVCLGSIALVMIKGNPEDRVNLDSVSEIGEGLLSTLGKTKNILLPVSDEEEMGVGDRIHERILKSRFAGKPGEAALESYIHGVGSKVAENVKRPGIKYKFHLVEGYYPAAFSSAGGHIYVTTGLIKALESEAELAGVLAHEITHVDAKHCIGSIQRTVRNEGVSGPGQATLAAAGFDLFLKPGYSEAQETEADAGGVYLSYRAGYHPMAIIHAFELISKDELLKSGRDDSATPVGDTLNAVGGMVARYFHTHPPTEDRMNKIRRVISDNKLMSADRRFYIGRRNYKEKISGKVKRYKEEFSKDYIIEDEKKSVLK